MPVDLRARKLANLAVKFCIEAKPGDKVVISGAEESLPFLTELYKALVLNGSIPVIRFGLSNVSDFFYKYASKPQLEHFPNYWFDTVKSCQGYIGIDTDTNTRELTSADSKKLAARQKLLHPISDYIVNTRDKIKRVTIAYPCISHAQEANMSLTEWENFVYTSCLQDWSKLRKFALKLKSKFKEGSLVEIKGENINLKFKVHGKKAAYDLEKVENMPAGEVFMAPFRESLEGEIKFDYPIIEAGKKISGIYLKFEKGKIVDFDAEENKDYLKSLIETDENSHYIGEFGIGFNPKINKYSGILLFDEKINATIHLAIGMAYKENGGGNDSSVHLDIVKSMKKAKILVDNKIIQENGIWKI